MSALRRVSILTRLLGSLIVLSVLPPVVVGGTAVIGISGAVTKRIVSYAEQLVGQVAKRIEEVMQRCLVLSENLIVYGPVQRGLSSPLPPDDLVRSTFLRDLDRELGPFIYRFGNVHGVSIFANDGTLFYETGYEQYPAGAIERLKNETLASQFNASWSYLRTVRGTNCIALGRSVNSAERSGVSLGFLVFVLSERTFARDSYGDVDMGPGSNFIILDGKGSVVSTSDPGVCPGVPLSDERISRGIRGIASGESGYFRYGSRKEEQYAFIAPIGDTDWRVLACIPYGNIAATSRKVVISVVLVAAFSAIASIAVAMLIYRSISDPVNRLSSAARAISSGRFDITVGDPFPDEMGVVSRVVDEMCVRLGELLENVRSEQERKRAAELRMLQAQIKPHFLFNALDSIRWTATLSGNETVAEVVSALSGLLRASIVDTEDRVPLSAELENVHNYALIQKLRYGDSFDLRFDIEDGIEDCEVPKLLLQPLVENSIIHGIGDDDTAKIIIELTARREGDVLRVVVSDNGKGFTGTSGEGEAHCVSFSGIGVKNVRERIRLSYGDDKRFGLVHELRSEGGVRAIVTIPFLLHSERSR
ncbi:MAG TPA: sensor histidine kinase [Spirochaetia bacterium]|nr:sensor histidine kinase [Spirochaetia bacterium]